MPITCHRKEAAEECSEPGDFAWLIEANDGDRSAGDDEVPTHIWLAEPFGLSCRLPVQLGRNAGRGWEWDGNRERPTLSPSLDTNNGAGARWHGWLFAGELHDA